MWLKNLKIFYQISIILQEQTTFNVNVDRRGVEKHLGKNIERADRISEVATIDENTVVNEDQKGVVRVFVLIQLNINHHLLTILQTKKEEIVLDGNNENEGAARKEQELYVSPMHPERRMDYREMRYKNPKQGALDQPPLEV